MKAINKDILKEIIKSKGRFLSILIMVAIGVLVFVGLKVTGPIMINRADKFLDKTNAADLILKSQVGLEKEDIDIVKSYGGFSDYEVVYENDYYNKDKKVMRINSINEKISKPEVVEGKLPEKSGEIALNVSQMEEYKIGDNISLEKEDLNPYGFEEEEKEFSLKTYDYKVTGFVRSPNYVDNVELGSTKLGAGVVDELGFILKEDFNDAQYSKVDILLKSIKDRGFENKDYREKARTARKDLENLFTGRKSTVYEKNRQDIIDRIKDGEKKIKLAKDQIQDGKNQIEDAKKKVQEGYQDYEKQKAKYEKSVADGKKSLDEGRKELLASKPSLDKSREELKKGKAELDKAKEQVDKGKEALDKGKAEYEGNLKKVEDGINNLNAKEAELKNSITQIDQALVKIEQGKGRLPELQGDLERLQKAKGELEAGLSQLKNSISEVSQGIAQLEEALSQNPEDENIKVKLEALKAQKRDLESQVSPLEAKLGQINTNISQVQGAINEINSGISKVSDLKVKRDQAVAGLETIKVERKKLEDAKPALAQAKKTLDEQEKKWQEGKDLYDKKLKEYNKGKAEFDQGEIQYNTAMAILNENTALWEKGKVEGAAKLKEGLQKLKDSEKDIAKNEEELKTKEKEAEDEIDKAQEKLDNAGRFLKVLMKPEYVIDSRESSVILYNYYDEASRLDIISNIFPVFFFFIAILVSLTTMTRMVEEQRIQIGTLKALGYKNLEIMKKYFIYGGTASVIGSILGVIIGHKLISPIIFGAYASHYIIDSGNIPYNLKYSLIAIALGVLCTSFAGVLATNNSLRENASSLLRPKPPKSGVRILLERVGFIWNKLSFMEKVTMRNLFRYKKRMLMTIIGISGCTGLIFMGFGIKDSLSSVMEKQYGEIFQYDTIAIYNEDISPSAFKEYKDLLEDKKTIRNSKSIFIDNLKANSKVGPDNEITLIVPENTTDLIDFIKLRDRKTGNPLTFKKGSVIISEKLAKIKSIKVGDDLEVKTIDNAYHKLKVGGISELYAGHNIYMPRDYYEKIFGEEFKSNGDMIIFQKSSTKDIDKLIEEVNDNRAVVNVLNVENYANIFDTLLNSLNIVVFVIITFSCILAFVVLYNLTNINVSERLRELSTIKVLGFYDKEVTAYIYRETFILTLIGILFGYLIGYLMHFIIINKLIPDSAMLDPRLRWTNFLLSGLITLAFAFVVMVVIHRKLKKVDMVEALKAIE